MKTHLIVVGDPPATNQGDYDNPIPRYIFDPANSRNYSEAVVPQEVDPHAQNWMRDVKVWRCGSTEVEAAVDNLTRWHGDVEIHVYELKTVYYRAPGTLASKAVTKDGVLPF